MEDDLDTPRATAVLFDAIRRANVAFDARETARGAELTRAVLECFAAVGLRRKSSRRGAPSPCSSSAAAATRLGPARDFAAADHLRAEIVALGYVVEDTPAGTRIRR